MWDEGLWYNVDMLIRQILRVSDQGVSRPYQCLDELGNVRWCKGNHTGLRSLICEWICGRIGHALGLPVPPCDILRLDVRMFDDWRRCKGVDLPQLVTEANPYVFGSVHVADAKDVFDIDADLRLDDPLLLAKIYLFDELVHNTDRTEYNTNLLSNAGVHVIDHNNAFDPAFDSAVFSREHALRRFREAAKTKSVEAFKVEMRTVITDAFLNEVWTEMPTEWTESGGVNLSLDGIKDVLAKGLA